MYEKHSERHRWVEWVVSITRDGGWFVCREQPDPVALGLVEPTYLEAHRIILDFIVQPRTMARLTDRRVLAPELRFVAWGGDDPWAGAPITFLFEGPQHRQLVYGCRLRHSMVFPDTLEFHRLTPSVASADEWYRVQRERLGHRCPRVPEQCRRRSRW